MTGALAGLRVLDVATLYPGPLLAALLGDLGADVVKVEPPTGDPLRELSAPAWTIAARNKRSVVVDFDRDDGLSTLHDLIAVADVAVFNQPARLRERWRCSDAALAERNARLVIAHVSAFGTTGHHADQAGNGTLAEAFVGLPEGLSVPIGDTVGAIAGVGQVLAALYRREHAGTGRRQVVDVALYEALVPLVAPRFAGADTSGMVRGRFVAGDGREVAVSATTPSQRQRLEELAGGDVAVWMAGHAGADAVGQLVAARVPAVIVNDVESVRPELLQHTGSTPALGEHTTAVVEEWLHEGRA